jgi:hypothetical protein
MIFKSNLWRRTDPFKLSLLCLLLTLSLSDTVLSQDLGNGFFDHGVASPNSNHRGVVATVDGNERNVILLWLFDHRGGYALQMIDAETGKSEQFLMPFPAGDAVYSSILSSKNKFYTLFNNHFVEFDPVKRAFTFEKESLPQMAMGMTEDDHGVIWAVTYPNSGMVSFNPITREFRDYGYLYNQNWRQYPRYIAADNAGWVYFGIGTTASQIIVFDPATGKAKQVLEEAVRKHGSAFVYRDLDGKVYGQALNEKNELWYEFYKGNVRRIGKHDLSNSKPFITGGQDLFYRYFPDGKLIKDLDLIERKLVIEDPKTNTEKAVNFDYASEGAWVMGVAVAPDGTIAGGTTFPMRFFNYNPKTGKLVDKEAFGQFDAMALQGDRFYFGVYPTGSLLEWDPSKPWVNTIEGAETNPLLLASSTLLTQRPHRVLAYPDGKTIIMSGTPEKGYTGGGLLFWDREKKTSTLLKDSSIIPDQSTFSIVALPKGKFAGGTTTSPGTGGIRKAKEAELYIMDMASKRVEWHKALFPGVQEYSDICFGPDRLIYGITDRKKFFVFDPIKLVVVNQQDIPEDFGTTVAKESLRVFILGPNNEMYMLFKNGIVQVEPGSFKMTMKAKSPVPINTGGDYLDGRIYFVSGSHLCSYKIK